MSEQNKKIEEAKKKGAGLFKYFKHLIKDPVKTLPEAKARQKEVGKVFLIFTAIALIPQIISGLIELPGFVGSIIQVITIVAGIGMLVFGFVWFAGLAIVRTMKQRECTNCKEQITYSDKITYEVLRQWEEKKTSTTNNTVHVHQTEMARVRINCVCQNCGTAKTIEKDFRVAKYKDGILSYSYEIPELIKGFFTGEHIQV